MFCAKCGKEIDDDSTFCIFCGQKTDGPVENRGESKSLKGTVPEKNKKGRGGITALIIAVVLVAAASIGCVLYFTGDAYNSRKNMKLAEKCLKAEEYEEALAYLEKALKRDPGLAEGYARSADVYVLEENYEGAFAILERGLKKTRGDEKSRKIIEEKIEEVKRAENAAVAKKLQNYLENELVSQYGYADLSVKKRTISWRDSWEETQNWTSAIGIANVEIRDWDGDERDEMLVILLEEENILLNMYEIEKNVPVKKAECSEGRCGDMIGYDVTYSVVKSGRTDYLLFRESMSGILSDGYEANVKLYCYDGANLYTPLAILQTSGGSSDFAYTAYEYDGSGNLLSEELVFDEVYDHAENYDRSYCYERVADLFGKYGLNLDGSAAIDGEKELFDDLETAAGYQELLALSMWGVYQYDNAVYHFNDWDSPILDYQGFFRGEKTVRVREGAWFGNQEQVVLTFQDLLEKVEEEYEYDENNPSCRIEYAYLDCGGDGIEELAVQFVGLYGSEVDSLSLVISRRGGELELLFSTVSWPRSDTSINYYGCIHYSGSNGAGNSLGSLAYINGESEIHDVYSATILGDWWIYDGLDEAGREAFEKSFEDRNAPMGLTICDVNGSVYYVADLYDFSSSECRDFITLCQSAGKVFIQEEELEDIIRQRMNELGLQEEWLDGPELYWNWLWY